MFHTLSKKALTVAVLLGFGFDTGVGTGTAALIQGPQYYNELWVTDDEDIRTLEQSISKLDVVLQNTRALDLFFLKEGGLYAALGE